MSQLLQLVKKSGIFSQTGNNGVASLTTVRGKAAMPAVDDSHHHALPNHKDGKVLHPELLNTNVKKAQYAVRGELYLRAEELRKAGKEIIFTNGT